MSRYVRAYHLILSAYGFWLPDDPRGSWSDFVRAWELRAFGPATRVHTHRSLARAEHDHEQRLAAKRALVHRPVAFDGRQALAVVQGFARYAQRSPLGVYACAVLPDHAHLVVARHHNTIERIASLLKGAATAELAARGLHPFADTPYQSGKLPSPWACGQWSVFLDDDDDIERAVRYVEMNPVRAGLRRQNWLFVTRFQRNG